MAEENDQGATDASTSGDASPRQPYRDRLAELHAAGDLGDSGFEHRSADIEAATTWGDLEKAIAGLDRGDLEVPTRRRQRRELPAEAPAAISEDAADEDELVADEPDDDAALADDDDLTDDDADEDDLDDVDELDDDEVDEDDLDALADDDDADEDDDLEDDDLEDDEDDLDDDDLDDDDFDGDDFDDEDDEPVAAKDRRAGKAVATTSGKGAKAVARSTSGRQKKGRPTPKRPTAVHQPERTGPVQFVKESIEELRKVVYPTSSQLGTYFVVVLVFVLFVIGFTSGLDYGFGQLVLAVFG